MHSDLYESLAAHISAASRSVLIVAPYIKRSMIERLVSKCAPSVQIKVVTVWEIADLQKGASDLDVWLELKNQKNAQLLLRPSLHAKYYRSDSEVMLGSANVTSSGLGQTRNSNLELLVALSSEDPQLSGFEDELFAHAVTVTDELYWEYFSVLNNLPDLEEASLPASPLDALLNKHRDWRPITRYPENLFSFYLGNSDALSAAANYTCEADLSALSIPTGLSKRQFYMCVRRKLEGNPEFQKLYDFGKTSRRFGEVRNFLEEQGVENGGDSWQTWMRWLKEFAPDKFDFWEPNYSEVFQSK